MDRTTVLCECGHSPIWHGVVSESRHSGQPDRLKTIEDFSDITVMHDDCTEDVVETARVRAKSVEAANRVGHPFTVIAYGSCEHEGCHCVKFYPTRTEVIEHLPA